MTEAEWDACTDPEPMLEFLRGKASDRKLRLFGSACCRRIWERFKDERSCCLVEISEQFADGKVNIDRLRSAFEQAAEAQEAIHWEGGDAVDQSAAESVLGLRDDLLLSQVIEGASGAIGEVVAGEAWERIYQTPGKHWSTQDQEHKEAFGSGEKAEKLAHSNLVRDIFGRPFCSVTIEPAWLARNLGTAVKLAQAIYDDRAFDRLPILADALEDAGCYDVEILGHCRGPGPHVRGCWVVDLLTGRQ